MDNLLIVQHICTAQFEIQIYQIMPLQIVSLDLTHILKHVFVHNLSRLLVPILLCLYFHSIITDNPIFSPKDSIVEKGFSIGRDGAAALASATKFSLLNFPKMMKARGFGEVSFLVFIDLIFCVFFRETTS